MSHAPRAVAVVLLFGGGTGTSSTMEQLVAELKRLHTDLAKPIVGTVGSD
jgi:hypothetical protein